MSTTGFVGFVKNDIELETETADLPASLNLNQAYIILSKLDFPELLYKTLHITFKAIHTYFQRL